MLDHPRKDEKYDDITGMFAKVGLWRVANMTVSVCDVPGKYEITQRVYTMVAFVTACFTVLSLTGIGPVVSWR